MGSADKVKLSAGSDIADLRKAVKAENADGLLKGISPAQLTVYGNKAAFCANQSLEVESQLTGLGASLLLIVVIHNDNDMDIDIPLFDPNVFRTRQLSQFPFFDPVIEKYLKHFGESALLARDDVINQVNAYIANRDVEKYQPIVCSTSRGMGKSAFIEAIGMQLVKTQLQNQLIMDGSHSLV